MTDFKRVFIDTSPFIYYLERSEMYFDQMHRFFTMCHDRKICIVTSALTVEEYCVYPYRNGKERMIENFDRFLEYMDAVVIPIDALAAKRGAEIRARYKGFKAMDALQIAVAVQANCDMFFTNDRQLRQEIELPCITMDNLE